MSIESRLQDIAGVRGMNVTGLIIEYLDTLHTLHKFVGYHYKGRESHLKWYAYKLIERNYK